jgi:copper chaperone CopZ
MVETIYCVHCGAVAKHPVTKTIEGRELKFCCGGCLQVYEMMLEEGLLPGQSEQGKQTPSQMAPEHPVDRPFSGSVPLQTITLPIVGMSCANCVARVERGLRSVPGVQNVSVSLVTGRALVEIIPGGVATASLRKAVEKAGYKSPLVDS